MKTSVTNPTSLARCVVASVFPLAVFAASAVAAAEPADRIARVERGLAPPVTGLLIDAA